ncbi:MAG: translation elongation factor [Sulfolobales archaeon]|nr:translation elongation factor [Sulfolobales archaeon]MCG2872251.1 translation elongation factor [Sulfolobales archaeon]MCG2884437.1 translation elongation factor [Sulfolobales archaeon]
MHVVFKGSISAVLASDPNEAKELAERLGKRTENNIYYRRIGDLIRSVLVPEKLSDQAEALSLSTAFYLKVSKFDATTAELALLAEASGLKGIVMTHDRENFMRYFGDLGISKMLSEPSEMDEAAKDLGYVYVDRAFNVKGVGTVVLGFALTEVAVHDKLVAYPMMKEVEVKSIQVLDEDQERVLPGTRIGFALRNVKLEEIEGVSALIKPGVKLRDRMSYTKFKWASEATSLHLFAGGLKVMVEVSGNELKLGRPIPETVVRGILVNFNARPKTPKVFGWAHS